jgi:hypothetical protein
MVAMTYVMDASAELDRLLAGASQAVRDEYQRRMIEAVEQAVKQTVAFNWYPARKASLSFPPVWCGTNGLSSAVWVYADARTVESIYSNLCFPIFFAVA